MEYVPYYDTYVIDPVPTAEELEESDSTDKESSSDGDKGSKVEGSEDSTSAPWNNEQTEPVRVTLPTRYVIEGQTSFEIAIGSSEVEEVDDLSPEEDELEMEIEENELDEEEVEEDYQQNGRLRQILPQW